jgi:hypothetical protein
VNLSDRTQPHCGFDVGSFAFLAFVHKIDFSAISELEAVFSVRMSRLEFCKQCFGGVKIGKTSAP